MDSFIACHECDVIHRIKPLPAKEAKEDEVDDEYDDEDDEYATMTLN